MAEKQRTIAKEVKLSGKGLHSGKEVEICFKPSVENSGYLFSRVDLDKKPVIQALAENVVNTARGTTIQSDGAHVMTIEHVCAAIFACEIDNVLVEVNGPEMPIMDGSSKFFVEAIESVGTTEQSAEREYFEIKEKLVFTDGSDSEIVIHPNDKFSVDVHIDFNSKVIGHQFATMSDICEFKAEIASCKTFVFLHELEILLKNNLIKGGDLDNALIIVDRAMEQEELDRLAELFNKPKVKVLPEGILNNTYLSFENEPARHKLLDVIGDLSLTGIRIKGKVIAKKPGHHVNTECAKVLRKTIKQEQSKK